MIVGRVFGWILAALGLAVLAWDYFSRGEAEAFSPSPLGKLWFQLDAGSLNGLQAGVERYISADLWDFYLFPMLQWPAFLFFLVPGLLLVLLCRRWWGGKRQRKD